MEIAYQLQNNRFNDLNKLGLNKPKVNHSICLHTIGKKYKIKISKIKKEELIKKIIEYENTNNIITELNNNNNPDQGEHIVLNLVRLKWLFH